MMLTALVPALATSLLLSETPLHGDAACAALDGKTKSRLFALTSADQKTLPFDNECLAFLISKGNWEVAEGDNRGSKRTGSGVTFGAPVPSDYSPWKIREKGFSFDWLVGVSFGGAPAEGATLQIALPDEDPMKSPKLLPPRTGTAYFSIQHKDTEAERKAAFHLVPEWRGVGGTITIDKAKAIPFDHAARETARVWLEATLAVKVRAVGADGALTGPPIDLTGKLVYRTRKDP